AVAGHVLDGNGVAPGVVEGDDADGRVEAVRAGGDAAEVGQRDGDADGAVAAHADGADVVEEDDAGDAGRLGRLAQQGADEHGGAARLVDHGGAEIVVLA